MTPFRSLFAAFSHSKFGYTQWVRQFLCVCASVPRKLATSALQLVSVADHSTCTLSDQAKYGCCAAESPQWRKGPAAKPVLCNACGTRFRRTSQLNIGRPVLGPARTGPARKRCAEQVRPLP